MEKNTHLTIMEFKKLCEELSPQEIIFASCNHPTDPTNATLNISFGFPVIKIFYNPNRILLAQSEKNFCGKYINQMSICRIKAIIYKDEIAGNKVFSIVCGNLQDNTNDLIYDIILQ